MSKKITTKQSNTIFNYFQSPKSKTVSKASTSEDNDEKPVVAMDVEDETPDTPIKKTSKKRSRLIDSDSDEEDSEGVAATSTSTQFIKKFKKESADNPGGDSPKPARKSIKMENATKKIEPPTEVQWLHERLDFLQPNKIRDGKKRKMDDPEYDPGSIYVPEAYLNSLTPAMRQWWILKSNHFDSVLFFKVGKFYELYHMDAIVGVNHLGFSYMKGEFAHSGFPETAYGRMAQSLMEAGFKVARVEQTETPDMMNERCKNKKVTKFDKVVSREICQVSTRGSCVYGAQLTDAKNPLPSYMLAIAENQKNNMITYGVCFVDTSIGIFHLAEFIDDRHCSKLLVLLSEHPPALVLTERNKISNVTCDILLKNAGDARVDKLSSGSQFQSTESTIHKLQEEAYFKDDSGKFSWPGVLNEIITDGISKPGYELAVSALGACWWHLKHSLLDIQVFTNSKFIMYESLIGGGPKLQKEYMILDGITKENLNVLGKSGTIQKTLDFCCTAFGKRLLYKWICRPLCNLEKLIGRQKAIQELYCSNEWLTALQDILKKLPDLDRQIMKIHTFGNKQFAQNHPDGRAIFYEAKTYFKRKILDLLSTLRGFERVMEIPRIFKGCESRLLTKMTHFTTDGGMLCDLKAPLEYFKGAFDQDEAEKTGKIVPQAGIDTDFDNAEANVREINLELDEYLKEQKAFFQCNDIAYFGNDRKRYQIEIPEPKCRKVTMDYTIESTRKGAKPVKRYSTATTKHLLAKMMRAEHERAAIVEDLNRRIFEKFNDWYEEFDQVTRCLEMLDVLCSLAKYARTYSQDICLPKLLPFADQPYIKIENGRHPCIPKIDDYVPNDTALGTDEKAGILILTGPNMGGKSTLMRQVALIIVMAQMGSYVPASSCEFTLIDRIFTRLGAQDDIMSGQSTFLVEVSEASAILQHATKHSFVLLDELGRGTSTHDGNAIATAYMKKLLEIDCRVIYSTHYHTLVEHYGERKDIQLGHMACLVEHEGESGKELVTFLYKMEPGVCSNSYGFNVAKLAGLSKSIVDRARDIAEKLHVTNFNRQLYIQLFTTNNISLIKKAISSIKSLKF